MDRKNKLLNKKYWTKIIFIVLAIIIPLTAGGVYLFKSLTTHDGLTSSQINCILKDSRGYMWFGTPAGLYRYDGYTFRNFVCNSQDGSSLPDSYINNIQEGLDGELWVETASGYAIYHPQTESFDRNMKMAFSKMGIEDKPQLVFIDSHKQMWMYVNGKGVYCYNLAQQLLYEFGYSSDSHGIPEGNITSMSESKEGTLLVYDTGKIVCVDVLHQQHTVWVNEDIANQQLRKNGSLKAFADSNDNIWLYGPGTLMCLHKSDNKWDITLGDKFGMTGSNTDKSVTGIVDDKKGSIWISTYGNGLIRMDEETEATESVELVDMIHKLTNTSNIQSVYIDNTGLLWVGTAKHGVAFWSKNIYKFEANTIGDITAICQDQKGQTWFGTSDQGILGYKGQIASRQVTALATTRDGSLWAGSSQNGITRIKDGISTIYSTATDSMNSVIDDHINALSSDKTGNLWIATNGGLQVYNPTMNTFSTYTKENGKMQSNNITALHYADGNRMLIGTSDGLIIMQLSTNEMTYYTGNSTNLKTFTNNYITQVFSDSRGLIWVGTREGLNILNLENDSLNYITEADGLCNNSICGITEDKNRNVWVTTNNGACRIVVQRNRQNETFNYGLYNYDTSDGLQSNEFNTGAICTRNDGQILLGGLYGINWVRENDSKNGSTLPMVMLTQLFLGEEEVFTGRAYDGRVPLPVAMNECNKLILGNDQNTFTIKFAAGSYNQCEKLQFIYWMEGLDEDWRNGDPMKHGVTFTNLSSGDYTLHVKAVSADGSISPQERTLEIIVRHPWWSSNWMIALYLILIATIIYIWKIGLKKLIAVWFQKKDVIKTLRKQTEEIKTTSDELRQPMARMISIISKLQTKATSMEGQEDLHALHFQLMQIITRVTQMRIILENAEQKALEKTNPDLDENGDVRLPEVAEHEIKHLEGEKNATQNPTMRFLVVLIDDNKDFLHFIAEYFDSIYTFTTYDDIIKAANDLEDLRADLVLCKQNMKGMTGSELCNQLKKNVNTQNTKFVLITDTIIMPTDIKVQDITLAADDYIAKPFNLKETVRRLNKLLGVSDDDIRQIEERMEGSEEIEGEDQEQDEIEEILTEDVVPQFSEDKEPEERQDEDDTEKESNDELMEPLYAIENYSMLNIMDQQLIQNIEQYVIQNMSRGALSLEDMSAAMGMGRVPFFHKVKAITGKTPAELVRDLRLKQACKLLARTPMTVSEIAIDLGFMTTENFIHHFKERYGMLPLEYQLKNRNIK